MFLKMEKLNEKLGGAIYLLANFHLRSLLVVAVLLFDFSALC